MGGLVSKSRQDDKVEKYVLGGFFSLDCEQRIKLYHFRSENVDSIENKRGPVSTFTECK